MDNIMSTQYILPKTLSEDTLRSSGIHIGLTKSSKDMQQFVVERTPTGICLFNINQILEKISVAGKMMASYKPEQVLVYGAQQNHVKAIETFSKITGIKGVVGRMIAGSLTNSRLPSFTDARLILVTDAQNKKPTKPYQDVKYDARLVQEATEVGIPVMGICNTNASTDFIDYIIPANNKGNRSIATIFYLLSRAVLINSNRIQPSGDFPYPYTALEFETPMPEEVIAVVDENTMRPFAK